MEQLFGLKDNETLKTPFREIFCTPATNSVVRQCCENNGAVGFGLDLGLKGCDLGLVNIIPVKFMLLPD